MWMRAKCVRMHVQRQCRCDQKNAPLLVLSSRMHSAVAAAPSRQQAAAGSSRQQAQQAAGSAPSRLSAQQARRTILLSAELRVRMHRSHRSQPAISSLQGGQPPATHMLPGAHGARQNWSLRQPFLSP